MRQAGLLVWHGLQIAASMARPGVKTIEIDRRIECFFVEHDAEPLFKGHPGRVPFPATICASVNDEVVHGIPGDRILREGDILSVDTGCRFDGWCGDSALTFAIGRVAAETQKLLDVTSRTLQIAIEFIPKCKKWSQVAQKMEDYVRKNDFYVVETLVGHGIGREMHEDPQVPNYVSPELLKHYDFELQRGVVIAVEPMVNIGTKRVRVGKDHWTLSTADKSLSAHFEHTLAITEKGLKVLTAPPENDSEKVDLSAYCN
jgi:methionyl aminopeptidase